MCVTHQLTAICLARGVIVGKAVPFRLLSHQCPNTDPPLQNGCYPVPHAEARTDCGVQALASSAPGWVYRVCSPSKWESRDTLSLPILAEGTCTAEAMVPTGVNGRRSLAQDAANPKACHSRQPSPSIRVRTGTMAVTLALNGCYPWQRFTLAFKLCLAPPQHPQGTVCEDACEVVSVQTATQRVFVQAPHVWVPLMLHTARQLEFKNFKLWLVAAHAQRPTSQSSPHSACVLQIHMHYWAVPVPATWRHIAVQGPEQ